MKNIRMFYLKMFRFLVVKFSIYLNRRVFVDDVSRYASQVAAYLCSFRYCLLAPDKALFQYLYFLTHSKKLFYVFSEWFLFLLIIVIIIIITIIITVFIIKKN